MTTANQILNVLAQATATPPTRPSTQSQGNRIIVNPGLAPADLALIVRNTDIASITKKRLQALEAQYLEVERQKAPYLDMATTHRHMREEVIRGDRDVTQCPDVKTYMRECTHCLQLLNERQRVIASEAGKLVADIFERAAIETVPKLLADSIARDKAAGYDNEPSRLTQALAAAPYNLAMRAGKLRGIIQSSPSSLVPELFTK